MNILKFRLSAKNLLNNIQWKSKNRYLSNQKQDDKPNWISFYPEKHGSFMQEMPVLQDPYATDIPLQNLLKEKLPKEAYESIQPDLVKFGQRVKEEIDQLGRECELQPPKLTCQNAWGQTVDQLWTCPAWKHLKKIGAEEGLVALGYDRPLGPYSRLYQFAKLYLFAPSSGLVSCPLAMTDGAARTLEVLGANNPDLQAAFQRLTSRDPQQAWTSGQWMTEKAGGSDVAGGTQTVAVPQPDGSFALHGYKWFSSAMDSDVSLALARIADPANGATVQGTRGLTLFYLETRDQATGTLNHIHTVRLKDKLGTRQLPTAELLLHGSSALQVSEAGRGMSGMAHMLTLTRLHNATSSVAAMRRLLNLARDYGRRRTAFGSRIIDLPLHSATLARLEVEVRGALVLLMEVLEWMGKMECGVASEQERLLLRLMTPILKLYTAKQAMSVVSEGLESFGGQGYMEDTGLPAALRDSQVLPIWEGTTNVLSLDVLRSTSHSNGEDLRVLASVVKKVAQSGDTAAHTKLGQSLKNTTEFLTNCPSNALPTAARDLAYTLARLHIGSLLLRKSSSPNATPLDSVIADRWILGKRLCLVGPPSNYSPQETDWDRQMVLEGL